MRNFLSRRARELKPSGIRKFFDIASEMEGVISLGVGEPDFITPWAIRDAGISALKKGYTQYTFVPKYSMRELAKDIWELEKKLPVGTTMDMFNAELCNRSEGILMMEENPQVIVQLVDEFIEKYPRWRPENNRIRFFERRLPEACYSADR